MTQISSFWRRLLAHRRILATLSAMVCVLALCGVATEQGDPTTNVLVAASAIPAGTVMSAKLVRTVAVPNSLIPATALTAVTDLENQMTAAPIPAGAILATEAFVISSQATAGFVIIPLTVSDQMLAILRPGDHVSVFFSNPKTGEVSIANGIRVVTIPQPGSGGMFSPSSATFVLVEVAEETASQITAAGGIGAATVAIE